MKNKTNTSIRTTFIFTAIFICLGTVLSISAQTASNDNWTGFYVGGYGGGTLAKSNLVTNTVSCSTFGCFFSDASGLNATGNQTVKPRGFAGGVQAGYNRQSGKAVFGVETDIGSFRNSKSVTAIHFANIVDHFSVKQTIKTDWLVTVRPRVGFTTRKTLIYGTGGLAVTKIQYQSNFDHLLVPSIVESGSFNKLKYGWTAGGGAEFQVARHWSVKGEYLYAAFSRTSITSNNLSNLGPGIPSASIFTHTADLAAHNLRFGVNYRF